MMRFSEEVEKEIEVMTFAICMNDISAVQKIEDELKKIFISCEVIYELTFDLFLKSINKASRINLFIVDEKYWECDSIALIDRLKKSNKYKNSGIVLYCENVLKIDARYKSFHLDYICDYNHSLSKVTNQIKQICESKKKPVIPENFQILILDDNPDICELIEIELTNLNHKNFKSVTSIKEAKNLLLQMDFDLMLLDWNLLDGTCLNLVDDIKNGPYSFRTKNSLVMVITGRDDVDDILTLLKYGIEDHIIKPFDSYEFEEKISHCLAKQLRKE